MKVAIIGHGNVGGTLATAWAKKGHQIFIGTRSGKADDKAAHLIELSNVKLDNLSNAVAQSEIVLFAAPAHAALEVIDHLDGLKNKIVIDASNAVAKKPAPYSTAFHAFADKTEARMVKCFNSTGFENMKNPNYNGVAIDMFCAGDDIGAKDIAKQLATDAGFGETYDFGKSDKVELLEKFALSWINLAIMQGHGRDMAFKVIRR